MESYDAIVIGSGIGGLTAAGLIAAKGLSVLVVERHDRPGGYVHGFRRKRYHFDAAVHLISGCASNGFPGGQVIDKILGALGVRDEIEFVPVNPFAVAFYPGMRGPLPQTTAALLGELGKLFPTQVDGLKGFIELSLQVAHEASIADEIVARALPEGPQTDLAALLKYRRANLAQVCAQFISVPELVSVLTANWPYLGLPPSRLSFVYWATMFSGYLEDGACYCRGGFQRLADVLVCGLKRNGGRISFKNEVERIRIEHDQVRGVVLRGGETLNAPIVLANSDMRHTIFDLVGVQYFQKRFIERVSALKVSLSIFAVYLATDLDPKLFGLGHESFCYADFDHERNYSNSCEGNITWIGISIPTLTDPALAPAGQHLILLTTLIPYDIERNWKEAKSAYMSRMLELAEQYLPGLRTHLLYVEGASPKTMERYTQNYCGAAYGWEMSPNQIGPNRISNRCALEGLYFAGHWTSPGGGVYGAAVSGLRAAKAILGITEQSEILKQAEPL